MNKKGLEKWLDRLFAEGKAVTYPCGHFVGREWCRSFDEKLASCSTLAELEGFANRRRFDPNLPRWTAAERAEILKRKIKLEKGKRK